MYIYYKYIYMHICPYVYMYICIYMYIFVYFQNTTYRVVHVDTCWYGTWLSEFISESRSQLGPTQKAARDNRVQMNGESWILPINHSIALSVHYIVPYYIQNYQEVHHVSWKSINLGPQTVGSRSWHVNTQKSCDPVFFFTIAKYGEWKKPCTTKRKV